MSNGDVIIRAEDLSKVYRLYSKQHYRFLDMFGLLRKPNAYTEHMALQGINLVISRGEKVAFIGRNGAGKSTLLKLFTGVIKPTSGVLTVSQGAHALLQIGSGFHQDFTGSQNALAYLAHLGVSGKEAERRLSEIVDFAELEEYIDQPIKTYSTGMVARLMFSTSTAIEPELLVLDEILGVGDAYFANKSFERIRELCEERGTTVLLVSHDVYSAAKLCTRMIWLDRGAILVDGVSDEVIRAYEHSIRVQEESRLRAKALAARVEGSGEPCLIELSIFQRQPVRGMLLIGGVKFYCGRQLLSDWRPDSETHRFEPPSKFDVVDGRRGQQVLGGHYAINRSRLSVKLPREYLDSGSTNEIEIEIEYYATEENSLSVELWRKGICVGSSMFRLESMNWSFTRQSLVKPGIESVSQSRTLGSGHIWIEDVLICDEQGQERFVYQAGERFGIRCKYRTSAHDHHAIEVEFLLAFHRDGVADVVRLVGDPVELRDGSEGNLSFQWDSGSLGRGRYTFTLMAVRPGYFDSNDGKFYSINDDVYFVLNRGVEILVQGGSERYSGTGMVVPMSMKIEKNPFSRTGNVS